MIRIYKNYTVRIINRNFTNEAGIVFPKTAIVTLYDNDYEDGFTHDYGFLDTEIIYDLIDNTEETINLDECYIENFSLTAYRRTRLIDKKAIIKLKGFSARNSVFISKYQIDFSYSDFQNADVIFHGAYFFNGEVNFHRANFGDGNVDFNSIILASGNFNFSNVKLNSGELNMKNIISAKGLKNFEDSEFGNGVKNFSNSDFGGGEIYFLNVNFGKGRVLFKLAKFGDGIIDFHFSTFNADFISFESSVFGNAKVNFSRVDLGGGKLNFNRVIFEGGELSFESAIKKDGAFTMKSCSFGVTSMNFERIDMINVSVELDKSEFDSGRNSRVSFNRAKVKVLSFRSCHMNDYFDCRVMACERMILSNTVVRDIIDLKSYDYKVDIKTLDIAHMRLIGLIDVDWVANDLDKIIKNKKESAWIKADEFRTLKENFSKTGRYTDEDEAYVEFKRFELQAQLQNAISKNPNSVWWEKPYYYLKLLVFDKIGLYATNPVRVMFSMLVTYTFFSLLYITLYYLDVGAIVSGLGGMHDKTSIPARSFFFSAATFLTIGYGDFYPLGIFRFICAIEGFFGLFLMSYFTVAFVRKILR